MIPVVFICSGGADRGMSSGVLLRDITISIVEWDVRIGKAD